MRNARMLAVVLLAAMAVSAAVAAPARLVSLRGWIVDEGSGRTHANAESAPVVLENHETKETPLVLVADDGVIYSLADQKAAMEYVGKKIMAIGTVDENHLMNVGSFRDVESKQEARPGLPKSGD